MDTNPKKSSCDLQDDLYDIIRRLESLGIDLSILSDTLRVKAAYNYLQFGVARRLSIIRLNLLSIFEIAYPNRTEPLGLLGESSNLSMHIHSFFYHCYGALDNAAWSFAYELQFLNEEDPWDEHKSKIAFYGKKKELAVWIKKHHGRLHKILDEQKVIHDDIKNIRDAIAHRIPLYVPRAITPDQWKEQTRLYAKAEEAGPHDENYFQLREQADAIGVFKPWFYVEGDHYPQYDIRISSLEVSQHLLTILDAVKYELEQSQS